MPGIAVSATTGAIRSAATIPQKNTQCDWRECQRCRKEIQAEMYVFYGTNDYNFVKLENPPSYEPTRCTRCGKVIRLAADAYTMKG